MNAIPSAVARDTERLGELAMDFRGTRSDVRRRDIANEYSQTVERLIRSRAWSEMPPPEDQLPDDWMPKDFFDHWLGTNAP